MKPDFDEIKNLIDNGESISQTTTNRLVMEVMIEVHTTLKFFERDIMDLHTQIDELKKENEQIKDAKFMMFSARSIVFVVIMSALMSMILELLVKNGYIR